MAHEFKNSKHRSLFKAIVPNEKLSEFTEALRLVDPDETHTLMVVDSAEDTVLYFKLTENEVRTLRSNVIPEGDGIEVIFQKHM